MDLAELREIAREKPAPRKAGTVIFMLVMVWWFPAGWLRKEWWVCTKPSISFKTARSRVIASHLPGTPRDPRGQENLLFLLQETCDGTGARFHPDNTRSRVIEMALYSFDWALVRPDAIFLRSIADS